MEGIRARQILNWCSTEAEKGFTWTRSLMWKETAYGKTSPTEVGIVRCDSLCPLLAQTLLCHIGSDRHTKWKIIIFLHAL